MGLYRQLLFGKPTICGRDWTAIYHRVNSLTCSFNIMHRRTEESPVAEHFNGKGSTLAYTTIVAVDQLHTILSEIFAEQNFAVGLNLCISEIICTSKFRW